MSFMPEQDLPLFDSFVEDQQMTPLGLWLVVEVRALHGDKSLYNRLQVIWRRKGRKSFKPMRLKPVVQPVEHHSIAPFVADDWAIGVMHKKTYGILLDIGFHGLHGGEDYELAFVTEAIELLDMLAEATPPAEQ